MCPANVGFPSRRLALGLAAVLFLAVSTPAQTGPWTDGELLLYSTPGGVATIQRVVPETGASAPLIAPQYLGGWSGWMAFDSYRGGLLANISLLPDGPFSYRLWLVSHDGTAAALPGFTGSLRALCPTGDGRIYFIRHSSMAQGPRTVEYFDANNQLQSLRDVDGVTPFQVEVEHLLYHAPSNSLVGSSSNWWSATDCHPLGGSLYVIPLAANGAKLAGPVQCTSTSDLYANEEIMGLDNLPDGNVLVSLASGAYFPYDKLLSLNPFTMALTGWAHPDQGDINGGVWSARTGKAVIQAAGVAGYELRGFVPGQAGVGTLLPGAPIPAGGGYSPVENVAEVDTNGPGCDGFEIPYGAGLPGKGGSVPMLGAVGCPDIGNPFTLSINSVTGGAHGVLFVGLSPASLPFKGGAFLVGSVALQLPITVGGAPGAAGAGFLALPAVLADPVLTGLDLYLQAGFVDSFAVQGVSLSNGLRLQGD